jgi:hypothetical protein
MRSHQERPQPLRSLRARVVTMLLDRSDGKSCLKLNTNSTGDGLELFASGNKGAAVPWRHDGVCALDHVSEAFTSAINVHEG